MDRELSEHEHGTASVRFEPHRFAEGLGGERLVELPPIREMWMQNGVEFYLSIARCE
jgi:hypothetical protein